MIKPNTPSKQHNFLYPDLLTMLDPNDPLLKLAKIIPWDRIENEFAPLYSKKGRPAKPVRLMVGLLLLKQIENLSDENVVAAWRRNPYYQAFCGCENFSFTPPCNPSDLVHFRKRIGENGVEEIFRISVEIHGKAANSDEIIIDTTVQEKNITYPTDTKLRLKVIAKILKLAKLESIKLRRTYNKELKNLIRIIRFSKGKNHLKGVRRARKRIKTIANVLIRDVSRKLEEKDNTNYNESIEIYKKAVNQDKKDKNKIYSLHEKNVYCIAKGKAHKKYEFGNKVSIAITKETSIIVGAKSFEENVYDGDTIAPILDQISRNNFINPTRAYCDRGFRGKLKVNNTEILIPSTPKKNTSKEERNIAKVNFCRRSAIEPVIGHIKSDFRAARNYLKGVIGDTINILMACAAFNMKKWMNIVSGHALLFVSKISSLFNIEKVAYYTTRNTFFTNLVEYKFNKVA